MPSADLDPQAALERWRLVHAVRQAIVALEPPYREVLVLRDVEGLSGEEVCSALGIGACGSPADRFIVGRADPMP